MTLNQLKKRIDALVEMGHGRLGVFVDRGLDDEAGVVQLNSVQVQGMVTVNEDGREIEDAAGFPREHDVVVIDVVPSEHEDDDCY